jgi:hypothetical protein
LISAIILENIKIHLSLFCFDFLKSFFAFVLPYIAFIVPFRCILNKRAVILNFRKYAAIFLGCTSSLFCGAHFITFIVTFLRSLMLRYTRLNCEIILLYDYPIKASGEQEEDSSTYEHYAVDASLCTCLRSLRQWHSNNVVIQWYLILFSPWKNVIEIYSSSFLEIQFKV